MRRRLVFLLALAAGALMGLAFMRRLGDQRRDHVDLYFDDGSLVTLTGGDADPLLDVARSALRSTAA